jgi:hypothetical protein
MVAEIPAQTASQLLCPRSLDQGQQRAFQLYRRARDQAWRGQRWSWLVGGPHYLLDLASVEANCHVLSRRDAGLRTVAIDQIRGSDGRCRYFDRGFRPLHDEARGRWLNIARARQQARNLPPVALVRVGDIYFVQDGHHRISVARAMGQIEIDARVTVWQVTGSLPWDAPVPHHGDGLADQFLGLAQTLNAHWLQRLAGKTRTVLQSMPGC